jgi:hypothetical protein
MTPAGLPHSEISGSRLVCSSPELFAAYHVLHRLLTPRHPPSALSSLTELHKCTMQVGTLGPNIANSMRSHDVRRNVRATFRQIVAVKEHISHGATTHRRPRMQKAIGKQYPPRPHRFRTCGDNRARTGNLRRARAALSQLSYIPVETRNRSGRGGPR